MIPRIEQKIELSKTDYLMILRWLNFKGAKNIYPERKIISRYFDTSEFMMYQNTLEGIIPRKKIRVRTYCDGDFYDKNSIYNLEKKITTENSRYKSIESNICYPPLRDEGILDDLYGNCFEKIEISYEREYLY